MVQALVLAAQRPGVSGQVFNVGTGQGTSLLELLAAMNRQLGTAVVPRHAEPRAGDIRHSRADIGKARAQLGWKPKVTFAELVAEMVESDRTAIKQEMARNDRSAL